jgi:hypothetical protein
VARSGLTRWRALNGSLIYMMLESRYRLNQSVFPSPFLILPSLCISWLWQSLRKKMFNFLNGYMCSYIRTNLRKPGNSVECSYSSALCLEQERHIDLFCVLDLPSSFLLNFCIITLLERLCPFGLII